MMTNDTEGQFLHSLPVALFFLENLGDLLLDHTMSAGEVLCTSYSI